MVIKVECAVCRQFFLRERPKLTRLFVGDTVLIVYLCPAHKLAGLPYINREYFYLNVWTLAPDAALGKED